jgi:hypothetical protein
MPDSAKTADFRAFHHLAWLVLMIRHQGFTCVSGRHEMAKFEAFAFTVGFVATGFLALVASVPVA